MPISNNNDFNNISAVLETKHLPITVRMYNTNVVHKSELSN